MGCSGKRGGKVHISNARIRFSLVGSTGRQSVTIASTGCIIRASLEKSYGQAAKMSRKFLLTAQNSM